MKTNIARIPVQRTFCNRCSIKIKDALLNIKDITNVNLYPMESLIVFNFIRANEISKALNVLTELGCPEEGEKVTDDLNVTFCNCERVQVQNQNHITKH
ncbi:hypothetical protein ACOKFD_17870 [Flagellimonas sp. S174]|uniref:hypothetical protein n=1 Tax=Flagellimonas sp. S174 TaxID=3410790 RepID=UPI003BF46247